MSEPCRYHIIPIGDLREHEASLKCWCRPQEAEDSVYVHHAMDKREDYETGKLRLQ